MGEGHAVPGTLSDTTITENNVEGKIHFARRVLDRGLRASNQLLYKSIFHLFPALIESSCVLVLMALQVGKPVAATAALVTAVFALVTGVIMHKRVPLLRKQLREEGAANGCVEDALSLAETVAVFGAGSIEQERYAAGKTKRKLIIFFLISITITYNIIYTANERNSNPILIAEM